MKVNILNKKQNSSIGACLKEVLPVIGLLPFIFILMQPGGHVSLVYMCFIGYYLIISIVRPSWGLGGLLLVHANYSVLRCGDFSSIIISGVRTEMVLILIAAVLFNVNKEGEVKARTLKSQEVDRVEVALYLYMLTVILLSLLRFGVSVDSLMSIREKALIVPIYSVVKYIFKRDSAAGMIATVALILGATLLAFVSLLNYYHVITTQFPAYVIHQGSEKPMIREFFGFVTFRMDPLTSTAPGTTGMYFMLAAVVLGVILLYTKPKRAFYYIFTPCFVPLLWAAIMSLSFSLVIPLISLAALILVFGEKNVGVAKIFGLLFAGFLVSIIGYAGYTGGGALSIASYAGALITKVRTGLAGFSPVDVVIGKGLDIRTSGLTGGGQAAGTGRTVSWDVGVFALLYELGIFAFLFGVYAFTKTLKRAYLLKKVSRYGLISVAILIVTAGILIIHGSPFSTRPVDVIFIFGMAVIAFYSERYRDYLRGKINRR